VPDLISDANIEITKDKKFRGGGPESDFAFILSDG
jgi:hypothetical protein